MPAFTGDTPSRSTATSPTPSFDHLPRKSNDKSLGGVFTLTDGGDGGFVEQRQDQYLSTLRNQNLYPLPNGTSNGTPNGTIQGRERSHSKAGSTRSMSSTLAWPTMDTGRRSPANGDTQMSKSLGTDQYSGSYLNGIVQQSSRQSTSSIRAVTNGEPSPSVHSQSLDMSRGPPSGISATSPDPISLEPNDYLSVPMNRHSSPVMSPLSQQITATTTGSNGPRMAHRHTLQVPRIAPARTSREYSHSVSTPIQSEEAIASGRFSPTHPSNRRASVGLVRRTTRSMASDLHLDEVPQDEDALRWTEAIRQKRASKRRRREEEDDDRVIVGTKVDQGHVNWVTAYNMLTGIRFTVSRTNAKMDRELTPADFEAKHKFSFDVTGNELTPSAKYDFKFKDYAPWVFRHLRAKFGLDPADYLMSLTSKYILSELGSPGKSGSFFYFSRDYKYIIKTIHHAEHKLLRRILRDYYTHITNNPNTLISQFYGLHRVKIPYGRKIHFVVMNNLFPPHRDIHQMFDLKGSTIGRDFSEEDLKNNPRATMKDLNWLRRNMHLELGPGKKEVFIKQMERDVSLLQRLKIMDYSLLVGIHDVNKGNDEKLRDKTLQVFQPGGERIIEELSTQLARTPSRMETIRQAQELRKTLKREKPIPMGLAQAKMPEEMLDSRKDKIFYSDDGGFRATHEDGRDGEQIYYLGIIDCLTHYGMVKKAEHFWKGLSNNSSQISPIPPQGYGERFINFITGITMTREEALRQQAQINSESLGQSMDGTQNIGAYGTFEPKTSFGEGGHGQSVQSPVDRTMEKAQKQAAKTERQGRNEEETPERTLSTMRSPGSGSSGPSTNGGIGPGVPAGGPSMTLPVVEEKDNEAGSTGGRSGVSSRSRTADHHSSELPSSYTHGTSDYDDANEHSTLSESPTDYRFDSIHMNSRAERTCSKPDSGKHMEDDDLRNGKPLPPIPHLGPDENGFDDDRDPQKPNFLRGTAKVDYATNDRPDSVWRWGTS